MITSDGDRDVISTDEMSALLQLHAVAAEDVVHFAGASRLPMITHPQEFNARVFDWIEAVT